MIIGGNPERMYPNEKSDGTWETPTLALKEFAKQFVRACEGRTGQTMHIGKAPLLETIRDVTEDETRYRVIGRFEFNQPEEKK